MECALDTHKEKRAPTLKGEKMSNKNKRAIVFGNMQGKSSNQSIALVAFVVLAAVVVGGAFVYFISVPASIGVRTTTTPSQSNQNVGTGTCPSTGSTTLHFLTAYYNTQNILTQVNTSWSLYIQGQPASYSSGTTLASGTSTATVPCGSVVWALFGDGSTYYYSPFPVQSSSGTFFPTGENVGQTSSYNLYDYAIKPMATLASEVFFNGTSYSSTAAKYFGIGNGQTVTGTFSAQAGNGYYGDNQIEIVFAYNSLATYAPTLTGPNVNRISAVLPSSVTPEFGSTGTGVSLVAYEVPAISFYNYTPTYSFTVQTKTLNSNSLIANPINIYIKDGSNFVNNGQVMTNQFANPNTQASIGQTTVSLTDAIELYS